jgi:hypothetical protein
MGTARYKCLKLTSDVRSPGEPEDRAVFSHRAQRARNKSAARSRSGNTKHKIIQGMELLGLHKKLAQNPTHLSTLHAPLSLRKRPRTGSRKANLLRGSRGDHHLAKTKD